MRISRFLFHAFFFSMFLPTSLSVNAAGLRLTPYRTILIVFCLMNAGPYLKQLKPDKNNPGFFVVFCGIWSALALWVNHDFGLALETGGVNFIELTAPFFVASAYIKNEKTLEQVVKLMILAVAALLTISLPETITGFNWFRTLTDAISGGNHVHVNPRFGFDRAIATFDHAIINGVVSSSVIGLTYFTYSWWKSAVPVVATMTSLSSGAVASILVQSMLLAWEKFVKARARWKILLGLLIATYVAAEIYSNRSGVMALLSLIVFSPNTAYNRYYIWIYGTDNVADNPFFGIGLNDWVRPRYMGDSIDNYWLVIMMRYGLPALISYIVAIWLVCRPLFRFRVRDKRLTAIRRGWLCGLAGLCVSAGTVHYWNAAYIYFNFYLGLGLAIAPILKAAARRESLGAPTSP
jgi:hypothetical protein